MNYDKLMDACIQYHNRNGPNCTYMDLFNIFKKLSISLSSEEYSYIGVVLYTKRRDLDKIHIDDVFEHFESDDKSMVPPEIVRNRRMTLKMHPNFILPLED